MFSPVLPFPPRSMKLMGKLKKKHLLLVLTSSFQPGFCTAWCCSGSPKKSQAIQWCWLVPCLGSLGDYNLELGIALLRLCFSLSTELTGDRGMCDFTQKSCRSGVFVSTYVSQYSIIPELLYLFSQYLIEKWLRNTEKILVIIEISIEYCY